MGSYLDSYGIVDARRERIRRRILLSLLAVLVVSAVLYFTLRNYRETRQAKAFLDLLKKQDYHSAYRLWGCDPQKPCRDYSLEKFMEDWGPKADHGDPGQAHIAKTRTCDTGVIFTLEFPRGDPAVLWVERGQQRIIGFAPWPVCNPRMPAP